MGHKRTTLTSCYLRRQPRGLGLLSCSGPRPWSHLRWWTSLATPQQQEASLAAKKLVQDLIARNIVWTGAHLALLQDRRGLDSHGSHAHVYIVETCRPHQPYGLRSTARPSPSSRRVIYSF